MPTRKRKRGADGARTEDHTRREDGRASSPFGRLLEIVGGMEPFRAPDGAPYVTVGVADHHETYAVRSEPFEHHLRALYWEHHHGAPTSAAVREAVEHAAALAAFRGPEHPVCLRVGEADGALYLDLGGKSGEAVRAFGMGWGVRERPPVRFLRPKGMAPLPDPLPGTGPGLVPLLRPHFRLAREEQYVLLAAWLVHALQPHGPYPVLVFVGEQGAGKSTATEMARALVDPSAVPHRAQPRDERDLAIAAANAHVLAFNNLSGVPPWFADALCRLSTGGGFATRRLHTDREEVLFYACRPVILNGIEDLTTRPDLADRALVLELQPIPASERRPARAVWGLFHSYAPRLLGAALTALAEGYPRAAGVELLGFPRMADFAQFAVAAEPFMGGEPGVFLDAYGQSVRERRADTAGYDPVAEAVGRVVSRPGAWEGTATALLEALQASFAPGAVPADLPRTAQQMAGRLRRVAPALRAAGYRIDRVRSGEARTIRIEHRAAGGTPGEVVTSVTPSPDAP